MSIGVWFFFLYAYFVRNPARYRNFHVRCSRVAYCISVKSRRNNGLRVPVNTYESRFSSSTKNKNIVVVPHPYDRRWKRFHRRFCPYFRARLNDYSREITEIGFRRNRRIGKRENVSIIREASDFSSRDSRGRAYPHDRTTNALR